jgi:glycine/D-amino acid oxidase-like deaminating enzyme
MVKIPKDNLSYWRSAYLSSIYPKLQTEITADVIIIGAGITGLTSAYLLKQAGYRVVVLEKRTVGAGTTARTTGKVTSQHGLCYADFIKRYGKKTAKLYGEANQTAVEAVERIIRNEKIDCGWSRQDNYVYTAKPKQIKKFQAEAKAAADLGLPASFVTESELPFKIAGAVKFANQGKIHSQKYLLGLAKAVHGDGSFVFENNHVTRIRDGRRCYVKTKEGKVSSRYIIVATNVPTLPLLARGLYCLKEYPTESYIVAVPLESRLDGMYISPDQKHYSILPAEHGGKDLLLIGGGGHLSGLRLSRGRKLKKLARYAERYFQASEVKFAWSDRDYLAYDDIPLIGRLYPWSKNLYVGTAFKKWGLSSGTVAAMILSDLITGKDNPWSPVFDSTRMRPIAHFPRAVFNYLRKSNR